MSALSTAASSCMPKWDRLIKLDLPKRLYARLLFSIHIVSSKINMDSETVLLLHVKVYCVLFYRCCMDNDWYI